MLIDTFQMSSEETIKTDICIVGTGPAGITLAHELAQTGVKVSLLESGFRNENHVVQSLSKGKIIGGLKQNLAKSRCRQLGGASNFWKDHAGGPNSRVDVRLLPMKTIDFEKRDWVPNSGWPFTKSELNPFYHRVQKLLNLKSFDSEFAPWDELQSAKLPIAEKYFKTNYYQFASRDVVIKDLINQLVNTDNITIYLNTNVIEIETDESATTVTRVKATSLEGRLFWIEAKLFVLATGGIENARLLLASCQSQKQGLGNQNNLVGKFFMEHPLIKLGVLIPKKRNLFDIATAYDLRWRDDTLGMGRLDVQEDVQRKYQLLNTTLLLVPRPKGYNSVSIQALKTLFSFKNKPLKAGEVFTYIEKMIKGLNEIIALTLDKYLLKQNKYSISLGGWSHLQNNSQRFESFEVCAVIEQAPNPKICLELSSEIDSLGMKKLKPIQWDWSELEIKTIKKVEELFTKEIADAGLGKFCSSLEINSEGQLKLPQSYGGYHHMGTTRMHPDSEQGVVDENCKVHGISNLYIAGSSVFPTGSFANPTLTIMALAIRLADHLKHSIGKGQVKYSIAKGRN